MGFFLSDWSTLQLVTEGSCSVSRQKQVPASLYPPDLSARSVLSDGMNHFPGIARSSPLTLKKVICLHLAS